MSMPTGDHDTATLRRHAKRRAARLVTEVLAPAPIAAVLLLVVAWRSAPTLAEAVAWGLVAALFVSLIPMLFILRLVRRGRLTDHHVRLREQRSLPLLFGMGCVLVGLGLLVAWDAPRDLLALVVVGLAGLVVSFLVSLGWKISVHTGVAAGSLVILILMLGPALLVLLPVVGLIGWARVEVGDHSTRQVAMGALLGAAVAAVVFSLLR